MAYAIDPELQPALEFLPAPSIEDAPAARTSFDALIQQMNGELDESGVDIENLSIPGPAGAPEVPHQRASQAKYLRCCTYTAAAS